MERAGDGRKEAVADMAPDAQTSKHRAASLTPRTVTKRELVNRIALRTSHPKVVVRDVIQMFLDEITDELASGNRIEFRLFGIFDVRTRAARQGQNPRTLVPVEIPPRPVVRFKAGRELAERVSAGRRTRAS